MIRDAAIEAARELWLPTVFVLVVALFALPLLAESAVVVRDRALLDGVLLLGWVLAVGSGLRLGTRLDGGGLGPLLAPRLGDRAFVLQRLVGHGAVLLAQSTLFFGATAVHGPVRRVTSQLVVHGASCALEAGLGLLLTALVATLVRPWLAAGVAGALLWIGHLEQELLAALDAGQLLVRTVFLLVPSFERLDVQGAIVRGAPLHGPTVGMGLVEAVVWSILLAGGLLVARRRRDLL